MRLLTPFTQGQTYRSLLFLVMARAGRRGRARRSLIAGWTTIARARDHAARRPVLVGFRGATGLLARADAALARSLLGVDVEPPIDSGGRWFWGRGKAVLVDRVFWRQQAYLAIRMVAGFAVAVGMVVADRRRAAGDRLSALVPLSRRCRLRLVARRQLESLAALRPAGIVALLVARAPDRAARTALRLARRRAARRARADGRRGRAGLARGAPPGARVRRRRLGRRSPRS